MREYYGCLYSALGNHARLFAEAFIHWFLEDYYHGRVLPVRLADGRVVPATLYDQENQFKWDLRARGEPQADIDYFARGLKILRWFGNDTAHDVVNQLLPDDAIEIVEIVLV